MLVMMGEDPHKLIDPTVFPRWKLYKNPFYNSQQHHQFLDHLPYLSTPKIAFMDSELNVARAQIIELKAELEFERKVRKKVESLNKKISKELSEEKKIREAMERVCEKLAKEIASDQAEIDTMKREMEEERKMLRIAEVLREERVQMKLMDAKILFEEKLSELEASNPKVEQRLKEDTFNTNESTTTTMGGPYETSILNNNCVARSTVSKRRASPEAENPHIKRGIKGFVEFPRVVRTISSRGRQSGSKLECQKAQLRFLLRQKSPIPTYNLIMG